MIMTSTVSFGGGIQERTLYMAVSVMILHAFTNFRLLGVTFFLCMYNFTRIEVLNAMFFMTLNYLMAGLVVSAFLKIGGNKIG